MVYRPTSQNYLRFTLISTWKMILWHTCVAAVHGSLHPLVYVECYLSVSVDCLSSVNSSTLPQHPWNNLAVSYCVISLSSVAMICWFLLIGASNLTKDVGFVHLAVNLVAPIHCNSVFNVDFYPPLEKQLEEHTGTSLTGCFSFWWSFPIEACNFTVISSWHHLAPLRGRSMWIPLESSLN